MKTGLHSNRSTKDAAEIYTDGTYLKNNAGWHSEDSEWKAEQIRNILARNGIDPASVCEVGCGAGEIIKQLSLAMPASEFSGFEVSPQAFEFCRPKVSENLAYHLKNIVDDERSFDCLLCIDVFEHVEDSIGFLRSLRDKARYKVFHIPLDISALSVLGGSLVRMRKLGGHLHHYTPETAIATLEDSGYEILDWNYTAPFKDLPGRTRRASLAKLPRRILYALSPLLTIRVLGGCSLLVLAR